MKHYTLSVSNVKLSGGTDTTSTKRFLVVAKDDSIDYDSLRNIAIAEALKTNPAGIFHPISYALESVEIVGSADDFGDLLASTEQVEIRSRNKPNG